MRHLSPAALTDPARFTANMAAAPLPRFLRFAVPFTLTRTVRVTADGAQQLRLAAPVTDFHALTLSLHVYAIEFPTSVTVTVETGMQNESEDGWQTVDTFSTVVASPTTTSKVFVGLLRYVRYRVTLNGTSAITFSIQGVAQGSRSVRQAVPGVDKQCDCNCAAVRGPTQTSPVGSNGAGTAGRSIGVVDRALSCALIEAAGCQQYYDCLDRATTGADINACIDAYLQACINAKGEARRCRASQMVVQ